MHSVRGTIARRGVSASAIIFALAAIWTAPALAQSESTDSAPATGDIIVTGSRLASGFSAPTPVSVIGASRLQDRGASNVADALNEVPAFRASNTPAGGELTPNAGYVGGRILDLRGLGSVRTLTLVDGKRFVPSTTQATVDTNMIPSILLKRAEVVTGGASAAYGSDAVAGVVNLILDDNLNGLKANLQQSITKYGDNSETTLGLAGGFQVTDTLHFTFGGEYQDSRGTGGCQVRAFCRTEVLNFGRNPGDLSLPALNILPDVRPHSVAYNGVTVPTGYAGRGPILGPVSGITFGTDGTPRRFQYGSLVNSLYQVGGEGEGENIYFKDFFLIAPTERYALTGNLKWDVTPDITAALMVNYGHLRGEYSASAYRNTGITIQADNPFIPRSTDPTLDIPTLLAANNLTSFKLGKGFNELGRVPIVTTNNMFRTVFSLEGKLGGGWAWDAYYQYGRNSFRNDTTNNTVTSRMLLALDSVRNGAGQIVCRVNADANPANDAPGCVAYNPFGTQSSQAARDYVTADGFQTNVTTEHVVAANVRGNLFQLPAGPFAIAAGGEFRSDKVGGDVDPLSASLAFFAGNGTPVSGKIQVTEGYVEAELPILADLSFVHELSLNGAARRTHYARSSAFNASSTVNVTTWKFGGVYEPIPAIRFRATRSRDIRAPNVSELFGPTTRISGILNDPARDGEQTNPDIFSGSNPTLKPEKADTFTVGVVLQPQGGFLGRFRASVDYYDIKISDAISQLGQQNIATRCSEGDALSCSLITRAPTVGTTPGQITAIRDILQNVNEFITRGIDFEVTYDQPLGSLGNANVRLLATYVKDLITVDAVGPTNRAGQTGLRGGTPAGLPDWTVDAMIGWQYNDAFSLNTHVRWINSGFYNAAFIGPDDPNYSLLNNNSANTNFVPSRTYVDVLAQYKVSYGEKHDFTIFGGVDNLFNTTPPLNPGSHGTGNDIIFNPAGQTFKIGVRVNY